jgi:RNA polymerase sigma-70 factor (ECF subfamily)
VNEPAKPVRTTDLVPLEEERVVILRLQQGDRSAAAQLYAWYGDLVYRQVILARLPNPDRANDCLADTFCTALTRITTYEVRNLSIFFWLRRIAINKVIDLYRKEGRNVELPESLSDDDASAVAEPTSAPDQRIDADETRKMVETSMSRLNPRYAEVLRLRLLEDKSREECADLLGVKGGTLDVLLHRAAKAFRQVYPP